MTTPDRVNTGGQCRRNAVKGTTRCERHGGVERAEAAGLKVTTRADRARQRCTALKRDGTPCSKWAIHGAFVCRTHGGNLANVQRAAKKRLQDMLPLAVRELQSILEREGAADSDKLRAIGMLLDRTGLGVQSEVTVEVKPWERIASEVVRIDRALPPGESPEPTYGLDDAGDDDRAEDVVDAEVVDEPPRLHARPTPTRPALALEAVRVGQAQPPAHMRVPPRSARGRGRP